MLHGINMVIPVVGRHGRINMERVRLVHGNGGRFSHELTERFILKYFTNDLKSARITLLNKTHRCRNIF